MKRLLGNIFLILLVLLVSFLLPLSAVMAQPAQPQVFWGYVTLDGAPAPDGTSVTAEMDSVMGYIVVGTTTSGDYYSLQIPETGSGDYADEGNPIYFYVNGLSAGSSTFDPGAPTPLDLSATSPTPQYTLTINTNPVAGGTTTGAGTYDEGTVVPISAIQNFGWEFANWTGDVANPNSASTTVTMDSDKTVTANFTELPTYTLTMQVNGNGTTSPSVGPHDYPENTVVDISATPDPGWQFENWIGGVADPNSNITTVTMDFAKTVTAVFSQVPPVTLTIAVNGNGTTDPPVGTHTYPAGTVVDITATPDAGWEFVNWTGDVADPISATTTVTMDTDKTITANFKPEGEIALTMAVNGNGSTIPEVGTHSYPKNTVVDITAIPDAGWEFVNWTGDVADPNSDTTTVTMDVDKTVTANFSQLPTYTLTIAVNGNGTTDPPVGSHTYEAATVVDISATPDTGWLFDNWTGDVADPSSATTTVTMDSDKTVTANFSLSPDSTPPVISEISASNATRTSVDISWTTDEPSDSQVEYWASPGELTPLDETLVTEHLVHLTGLNPVTTYHYKAMSRDETGNLAVSGEFTFTTLGTTATFTTSDWDISLTKVDTGQEVTISFLITNNGELAGSYEVAFTVNGVVEATEELILDAGASEEITFTTTKDAVGAYLVTINGLSFSFEIEEEAPVIPPTKGPNWWLIIGIIAGMALLAIYIILLARRGKLKAIRWPLPAMRARPREEVADILAKARMEAEMAEERAKMIRAEEREGEPAEGEAWEAAEKAKIAAAEAREKWGRMEAEAKAKREAEEAKKAKEAEKKAKKEAKKKARPVEVEKLAGRLTVTALAAEKLRDALQAKTTDPEVGFRLTRSPEKPSQLKMTLDKEKEGDQVVESEGVRILILGPELVSSLEGMVIDYQETPQGAGFAISKRAPGK